MLPIMVIWMSFTAASWVRRSGGLPRRLLEDCRRPSMPTVGHATLVDSGRGLAEALWTSPAGNLARRLAPVAQRKEQGTSNPQAAGSNPAGRTKVIMSEPRPEESWSGFVAFLAMRAWNSSATRVAQGWPSRHARTPGQDQNAEPDKIKRCAVHPGLQASGPEYGRQVLPTCSPDSQLDELTNSGDCHQASAGPPPEQHKRDGLGPTARRSALAQC